MKEQTYGWYPPARGIWQRKNEIPSYRKECLYKHWNSRYNDQPGVPTPVPPTPIRAMYPPNASRLSSRPHSRSSPKPPATPSQNQLSDLAISGTRAPSVGTVRSVTSSLRNRSLSKAKKAWATQLSATAVVGPQHQPYMTSAASPEALISVDRVPVPPSTTQRQNRLTLDESDAGSRRSQSASMLRQRATPPPRPTKSAGSLRSHKEEVLSEKELEITTTPPSPPMSIAETCASMPRPDAPVPSSDDDEVESVTDSQPEDEGQLDYEEQLEKYGWRFEIPGDPLNLKRPCLPARLPYTVKVPVPKVAPNPPTGHMMNYDTYFYNTIPRKPMSFTIHEEWISEVLHAKRMALQKKEGTNYNYKQFAFSY